MIAGKRPWLLYGYAFLVYVFLFAPLVLVVVNSFNDNPSRTDWRGFTTRWYEQAWGSESAREAALNSIIIALIVAVVASVLGTAGALALRRARRWQRGFLQSTTYARIVIPELVLALALLIFMVRIGIPRGFTGIIIGHTVFSSAYVTVIVGRPPRLARSGDGGGRSRSRRDGLTHSLAGHASRDPPRDHRGCAPLPDLLARQRRQLLLPAGVDDHAPARDLRPDPI